LKKEGIAIVPGSFDPITNGHLYIIKKAAASFEKVYVAVMINDQKQYMFTIEQREAIAKACLSDIDNVTVISSQGWLWELARDLGAVAIVKGYRNEVDLEYENKMAVFNEERYPMAKTILIKAEDDIKTLSSTVVRKKLISFEELDGLVPQEAIDQIKKITPKN
jgi:pantetheine-phosphate adenylyltransferase